jgi:hypothetical protein
VMRVPVHFPPPNFDESVFLCRFSLLNRLIQSIKSDVEISLPRMIREKKGIISVFLYVLISSFHVPEEK